MKKLPGLPHTKYEQHATLTDYMISQIGKGKLRILPFADNSKVLAKIADAEEAYQIIKRESHKNRKKRALHL